MSPNFSWLNLITNALNLASNEPDNPDIMLQFMSQLTGQRLVRVDSNDGDVPSNVGRVHSNNVDVPSNVGRVDSNNVDVPSNVSRVDSNNGDVLSNGDLPKHQSNSCRTTPPSGGNNVVGSLGEESRS